MTKQQLHILTEKHVSVTCSVKFIWYGSCAPLYNDFAIYKTTLDTNITYEKCVAVLPKTSGIKCNEDILVRGYLPANIKVTKTPNLGITAVDNCPDVRNTKAVDVTNHLKSYGTDITIYDLRANTQEVMRKYNLETENQLPKTKFDAIILSAPHNQFLNINLTEILYVQL